MITSPAKDAPRVYLVVVPVTFVPAPEGGAWVESAFAEHLRMLLASLQDDASCLEVLAPSALAGASTDGLACVDPARDRIRFVSAFPADAGRLRYWLHLPGILRRLWSAVGRSRFVHSGPSPLFRPFENVAWLFGWMRRRVTIYVTDIDQRETPRMNYAVGRWSFGVYLRAKWIHQTWENVQHHIARWMCSLLMLKGRGLVRDFGRGRSHVRFILDSAYARDMILTPPVREAKQRAMSDRSEPLRVCYFGRLVAYKGVDRMLDAISRARRAGANVTFDVYGVGEEKAALEAHLAESGAGQYVRFQGVRAYGAEFFDELAGYGLLLAAPLSQDTPRSALDAQALGMPVLAFDTYYYRELAEDGAGVTVVPWPDVDSMAKAIVRLEANREELVELSRRAVAFAQDNTQDAWLERRAAWTRAVARGEVIEG